MKSTHSVLIVLGLASGSMLLPLASQAQALTATPSVSEPAAATPSVSGPASDATASQGKERGGAMKKKWQKLTPEERQKVKAAHEKAMQDPAVKAAVSEKSTDHKAYRKTVREAMLRADPTIGPLLEKMHPGGGHHHKLDAAE